MARRVLLVRHGESTNNVLMRRLFARRSAGQLTPREWERAWLRERATDPDLTAAGAAEARRLGAWMRRAGVGGGQDGLSTDVLTPRLLVYTSPFKRTLDTTRWMLDGLGGGSESGTSGARVVVHPELFETGGVYTSDGSGNRVGRGKCLSSASIKTMFPGFLTFMLEAGGDGDRPWYQGPWETDRMCAARAARVAGWMRRGAAFHRSGGRGGRAEDGDAAETAPPLVVMVMHANFISAVLKALCGVRDDESRYSSTQNDPNGQAVSFAVPNTATSLVDIDADGGVRIRWVGGVEHLGTASEMLLSKM